MLGIDLTKISRFENQNNNFINKVLHPKEIEEYELSDDKPKYLATRWAIKESIYKSNNKEFSFNSIRIIKENKRYKYENYNISTSNEDGFVIAVVQRGIDEYKIQSNN